VGFSGHQNAVVVQMNFILIWLHIKQKRHQIESRVKNTKSRNYFHCGPQHITSGQDTYRLCDNQWHKNITWFYSATLSNNQALILFLKQFMMEIILICQSNLFHWIAPILAKVLFPKTVLKVWYAATSVDIVCALYLSNNVWHNQTIFYGSWSALT